jgi:hypothetical protein
MVPDRPISRFAISRFFGSVGGGCYRFNLLLILNDLQRARRCAFSTAD